MFLILASLSGCSKIFRNPFDFGGGGDDDGPPSAIPDRVIEPTSKYSLAIGGVAPGRDELVIYDADGSVRSFDGRTLECAPDEEIVILRPRTGFDTAAAGSGVQMIATDPGVTAIRCTVDGESMAEVYEVTVPPQNLVQILVAEAGLQIKEEAVIDEDLGEDTVALGSASPTANALGSVIRNRIGLINLDEDPLLFMADASTYNSSPPASYYDAVILAPAQFSPTDSADSSYRIFDRSQDRNFLTGDWIVAYDQAVLTAAGIFNGDIADTTGGAFAFRSPSPEEWTVIFNAWASLKYFIPDGAGYSELSFPAIGMVQILIHPDVWKYDDEGDRPSFVFARSRTADDVAVSNVP